MAQQDNSRFLFIASLPKAGTYVMANVLESLGFYNTFWHAGFSRAMLSSAPDSKLLDFPLEGDLANGIIRCVDVDRNSLLKLMRHDQFCVGHLPPHVLEPNVLRRITVLFLYRDLRTLLTSTFHYFESRLPEEKTYASISNASSATERFELYLKDIMPHTIALWHDMFLWSLNRNALSLCLDDFSILKSESVLIAMRDHLKIGFSIETMRDAVTVALNKGTVTLNNVAKDERNEIWTPACEDLFLRFGGPSLQKDYDSITRV